MCNMTTFVLPGQIVFGFKCVLYAIFMFVVSGKTYTDTVNLLTDLQADYHKGVVPIRNQSQVLKVNVIVTVHTISEIDLVRGYISVSFSTTCSWKDEKLTWSPSKYGGTEYLFVDENNIWTPKIILTTGLDYTVIGGSENEVMYYHNGVARWRPVKIARNVCIFFVKYWPFDKQICYLGFSLINYKRVNLEYIQHDFGSEASDIFVMGEWIVESSFGETFEKGDFSAVMYTVKLRRQPMFYILTILIPVTFVGLLAPFVFLLPSESGERIGFVITIMLSNTVFLTVLSEELPRSANPISLVCVYVTSLVLSGIIITIIVIMNLRLYHMNSVVNVRKCLWYFLYKFHTISGNELEMEHVPASKSASSNPDVLENMSGTKDQSSNEQTLQEKKNKSSDFNEVEMNGQMVSQCLDKLFFIVSLTATLIPSIVFLIYLPMTSDYIDINT